MRNARTANINSNSIGLIVSVSVRLYREGLTAVLRNQPGIVVMATASDRISLVAQAKKFRPHIIFLDTTRHDSLITVSQILEASPTSRVLAFVPEETEETIVALAKAGVSGYVDQAASFDDLITTIRSVARGEVRFPSRIGAMLFHHVSTTGAKVRAAADELTSRESQILQLINDGFSNKEIATNLNIEISTTKNHVHHILQKLRATRRTEVVARFEPRSLNSSV